MSPILCSSLFYSVQLLTADNTSHSHITVCALKALSRASLLWRLPGQTLGQHSGDSA